MQKLEILYQDDVIAVVNKPSGLLSVSFEGNHAKTAEQLLEDMLRKNGSFNAKHRPFAVHRLDRDTSGVLLFALNENVQKKLMHDWHTIVTERLYRAVAENPRKARLLENHGLIDAPLAYNAHHVAYVPRQDETVETVPARTEYTVVVRGASHTLFELSLDTGKKNQIRAHLASKGYPLAGDDHYRAKTNPFGRLALHARTLAFEHPITHKTVRFEVAEPGEWQTFVESATAVQTHALKQRRSEELSLSAKKRLSRKERAHMDFIQQGKYR